MDNTVDAWLYLYEGAKTSNSYSFLYNLIHMISILSTSRGSSSSLTLR